MIYFLATRIGLHTIRSYLQVAGRSATDRVTPVLYETLIRRMSPDYWWTRAKIDYRETLTDERGLLTPAGLRHAGRMGWYALKALRAPRSLPKGTYVFADLERLSHENRVKMAVLWHALAESGMPVLNHPVRSMRRYELLRNLHERGVNTFNVYRLAEARWPERYPVFLRGENDHDGPRSPLLSSREELTKAIRELEEKPEQREEGIVTEFCDTADAEGLYRTYGAFIVGDRIFPKHLTFSRKWAHKGADIVRDDLLAEEETYAEDNPHEARLRELFGLARIQYGRIDYALLHGRVQVWEITTNPTIRGPRRRRHPGAGAPGHPLRRRLLKLFERRMAEALDRIEAT